LLLPHDQRPTPLPPGLFVDAEIVGRLVERVFIVPASAYRLGGRVFIVDEEDRLQKREVRLLRRDIDRVLLTEGLREGERVAVSAIEAPLDGMLVRVGERTIDSAEPSGIAGAASP
jgi:hypothetical protein